MERKMKNVSVTVVDGLPDESPCCGASVRIDQDSGEPYCKKCYEAIGPSVLQDPLLSVSTKKNCDVPGCIKKVLPGSSYCKKHQKNGKKLSK
jgi:hypothetical protein